MSIDHVVIAGASLAGLRTAEALRRGDFAGTITLIGAEEHQPYTRPPLSKQILSGEWDQDRAWLRPPDKLAELDLDLRTGVRATGLDPDAHVLSTDDGAVAYDVCVIATGARPRHLPGTEGIDGVHVLRTLDHSLALRDDLGGASHLVVVGGGFIGAEVASVAAGLGVDVTIVEPLEAPMLRGLGPELGAIAADRIRAHGVDLRVGVGVDGVTGTPRVDGVDLSDGTHLTADLVVVGIGVIPETGWLAGAGLQLENGVVCDETLAAVGVDDVWAAGDVARWYHPTYGEALRLEHWTVAADHGAAVAANILAGADGAEPHAPVPYVWSDQFGTKIQIVGRAGADDRVDIVRGSVEEGRFLAVQSVDGQVTGCVGFGSPRQAMALMMRMEDGPLGLDEARELAG